MGFLIAFVSAHPIVACLTVWLLLIVAFATIWHQLRSRYRDLEYERDLIALEFANLEQLWENEPSDISEVPTFPGSRDVIRVG